MNSDKITAADVELRCRFDTKVECREYPAGWCADHNCEDYKGMWISIKD